MSHRRLPLRFPWCPDSLLLAFVIILLDQNTKLLVRTFIAPTPLAQLGTSWLALVNVSNSGGLLASGASGYTPLAVAGSLLALGVVLACWWLGPELGAAGAAGAGLLLGGVFSNLLDRCYAGSVLDMFAIALGGLCRVTNIADGAILLSGIILLVAFFRFARGPAVPEVDEQAGAPAPKIPLG